MKIMFVAIVLLLFSDFSFAETIELKNQIKNQREKGAALIENKLKNIYLEKPESGSSSDNDEKLQLIEQFVNYRALSTQEKLNIAKRKKEIRELIKEVAHNIYNNINFSISTGADRLKLENIKKEEFIASENLTKSNVSVNSMILSLQLVSEVTKILGQEIRSGTNDDHQFDKYIEYTLIIYELSDVAIILLNNFEHEGFVELTSMANEHISKIATQKETYLKKIEVVKKDFSDGKIDEKKYKARTRLFNGLIKVLEPTESVWGAIKKNLANKEKAIKEIKNKVSLLEEKKSDASYVLNTLAEVKAAKQVKNILQDLFNTSDFIIDMPFYIPDALTVELYLGVEGDYKEH